MLKVFDLSLILRIEQIIVEKIGEITRIWERKL
jgi:hypothetical protein